jgi:acyl carrier protein
VGLSAAQANRGERLAQRGFASIAPAQGMEMLGRLLREATAQVGVLPINLRQWRQFYPQLAQTPLLAELIDQEEKPPQGTSQMHAALLAAAPSERSALLEAHLQEQIARVVRLPAAQIEPHTSFKSFGLDSLMAMELRNCLEGSLGVTLPVTMIFGYPTVIALASHLMSRLQIPTGTETESPQTQPAAEAPALQRIAELSDEEVERIFAARVGRKRVNG